MSRKGQGISINVVIIAALALVVLVIMILLIAKSGKTVDTNTGSKSCLANGGTCRQTTDCGSVNEAHVDADASCNTGAQTGYLCCRYAFGG